MAGSMGPGAIPWLINCFAGSAVLRFCRFRIFIIPKIGSKEVHYGSNKSFIRIHYY